jgi:uncharacterized protein (TIGR04255 family)
LALEPHPRFPSPTIALATCEITFNRNLQVKLSTAELYKLLGTEFPEIQPVSTVALQIIMGAPQEVQPPVPPPFGVPMAAFRFAAAAGDRFVQISDVSFVHQTTASYPGWGIIKATILKLWEQVLPAIQPDTVTKIGLRYVNRIAKDEVHPHLGDWLRASDYIPAALIRSRRHFLARVETSPGDNDLLLLTLADEAPAETAPHGAIIFDIDRMRTMSVATGPNEVGDVLELLHEDIWNVFWSSRAPALEEKLKRVL